MEDIQKTILALEKQLWDATISRDVETYRRLLAEKSLTIAPYGILDKEKTIKELVSHITEFKSYNMLEPRLVILSKTSILVTYKAVVEAVHEKQAIVLHSYATTVYVLMDGVWKVAFHQQTPGN